jgi:TonB family protein
MLHPYTIALCIFVFFSLAACTSTTPSEEKKGVENKKQSTLDEAKPETDMTDSALPELNVDTITSSSTLDKTTKEEVLSDKDKNSENIPDQSPELVVEIEPDINAFVALDKEPKTLNYEAIKKEIGYPAKAKNAGIEGNIILRTLVDKEGNYKKHVIIRNSHPLLSNAVEEHVSKLRFQPAEQNGKQVMAWVTVSFSFKLLR